MKVGVTKKKREERPIKELSVVFLTYKNTKEKIINPNNYFAQKGSGARKLNKTSLRE